MIEFELDGDGLTVIGTGRLALPDIVDAASRIGAHPLYERRLPLLVNLRNVSLLDLGREELGDLSRLIRHHLPDLRKIAVVAGNDFNYGISRMFQAIHGSRGSGEVRVFRDFYLAKAWIAQVETTDWTAMRSDPT